MAITTKRGDQGMTDLKDKRVSKDHELIELLGMIDETIASIVYAASLSEKTLLEPIVTHLSTFAAMVAGYQEEFPEEYLLYLEAYINAHDEAFEFSYPLDSTAKASINIARTNARKLERFTYKLQKQINFSTNILNYLNRLSDFLFILQI